MRPGERKALAELARLWGVQASYVNVLGHRVRAQPESILATLVLLGAPVRRFRDIPAAIRARRADLARELVPPVTVAWDGLLRLALPKGTGGHVDVALTTEGGAVRGWHLEETGGVVRIPERLPLGRHRIEVRAGRRRGEGHVIAAPSRAPRTDPTWGVFLPLYALHTRRSWGIGDLRDLAELTRWAAGLGAGVVATTPLDAAFLDEPFEPGPYSPASRLFWNELYLTVDQVPEVAALPPEMLGGCQREIRTLRRGSLVEHRRTMALKRRVLEAALAGVVQQPSARRDAFLSYVEGDGRLRDYALFRAALERHRRHWRTWPRGQREGRIRQSDVGGDAYRYHLYAQWLMQDQVAAVQAGAARRGVVLGLDLPLGCHPSGYDVWRERGRFGLQASTGAPPDAFFSGGQDWGFPPPHPDGIREDGYAYLRDCLRHVLSRAGVLRIDHIMGFHRLFWIPPGADPSSGVYVRYHPEEMYAVLLLEAHRTGATIVGEDLGTVPTSVRRTMDRHGVGRSFVLQTEVTAGEGLGSPPRGSAASLNTHDMPTFATFRRGADIDLRVDRGWLDPAAAPEERRRRSRRLARLGRALRRAGNRESLMAAALAAMADSDAGLVVVGIEDLWEEMEPHNIPGTSDGANWRRRTRYPLERFTKMPEVTDVLETVNRRRRARAR